MPHPHQQEKILSHDTRPEVRLRSFCQAEEIKAYAFDKEFGTHAQYRSIYTKKETLAENALEDGANVALAIADNAIIGFGVLNHPEPEDRWNALGTGIMMEVKVIEVARSWRSSGIARGILDMLTSDPLVEAMIVYMVGYSWTWDLDGTQKSAQEYRNMMIRLFEPFGFLELQTNEPNICIRSENLFMGRIGAKVSKEIRTQFKWLRFGVPME